MRYPDHFNGHGWESYIESKIEKKMAHIDKDCGLECEESPTCDFFVLGEKERDVNVCFFGTFRKRVKGLKYGSTSKYRIEIYPVFKGILINVVQYEYIIVFPFITGLKLPLLQNKFEKRTDIHVSRKFIAEKLIYYSFKFLHPESCQMACQFRSSYSKYCHFWTVIESEAQEHNCFLGHLGRIYNPYIDYHLPSNATLHLRSNLHKFKDFTEVVHDVFFLKKDGNYKSRNFDYGPCPGAGVLIANSTQWKGNFSLDNTAWQCSFVIIRIVDGKLRLKIPDFAVVRLYLELIR